DFAVWQRFGGRAWPTLIFIDPDGRVIGKHEGELPFEKFDQLVGGMLEEFEARGVLNPAASPIALEAIREPAHTLSFPGKVLAAAELSSGPGVFRTPPLYRHGRHPPDLVPRS